MSFKWKTLKENNNVISKDVVLELRKRIDLLAHEVLNSDEQLQWKSDIDDLTKESSYIEIINNLDILRQNNYCRQYAATGCTLVYKSDNSTFYGAVEQSRDSNRYITNNATEHNTEDNTQEVGYESAKDSTIDATNNSTYKSGYDQGYDSNYDNI